MLSIQTSFFLFLKGRCYDNQFWAKLTKNVIYSAPWHYKTDWNITIWISSFIVPMSPLHRVQIAWTLVQWYQRLRCEKSVLFRRYSKNWPISRISQQLLNQHFSCGRSMYADYKTNVGFAVNFGWFLQTSKLNLFTFALVFWNKMHRHLAYVCINSSTNCSSSSKKMVKIGSVVFELKWVRKCAATPPKFNDLCLFGMLAFWNWYEYHNFDFSRLIGNHFCTSCENLVRLWPRTFRQSCAAGVDNCYHT